MAVAAIALAAVAAGTAIYGGIKEGQANKKAKANLANRPVYNPLPEDDSELNLAEAQANQGMGGSAQQALQNNADRSLATSTNAALMGGADANTTSEIANNANAAYNSNAIYNDQVRQQHIGTLLNAYSGYAAQRQGNADKQFQLNKYAPWADMQQLYASQIAGGQQMVASGVNNLGKAAGQLGGGDDPDTTTTQTQTPSYNPNTDVTVLGNGQPEPVSTDNVTTWGNGGSNTGGNWNWNGITPNYTS